MQLTDVHWGYGNAKVNPDTRGTFTKALAAVNALEQKPDFVVFTGDLTQTTDDPKVRCQRQRVPSPTKWANFIFSATTSAAKAMTACRGF